MHQTMEQGNLLSYWVVKTYDPETDRFVDAFKSYGQNVANQKVTEYLAQGICAVVEHRRLPII